MSCCENFGIDEKGNYTYTAYATDEKGSNFSLVRTDVNIKREFVAILSSKEKLDEKESKFKEYFQGRFFNIKDLEPEVLKRVTKEEHNSDVSKLRVEMKELSVGINGQIYLNSPKPTKNGQYIAQEVGEYINLKDKSGQTIKVTEEDKGSGIVYILYNGTSFEKSVVRIEALGKVEKDDTRAVSGNEVLKSTINPGNYENFKLKDNYKDQSFKNHIKNIWIKSKYNYNENKDIKFKINYFSYKTYYSEGLSLQLSSSIDGINWILISDFNFKIDKWKKNKTLISHGTSLSYYDLYVKLGDEPENPINLISYPNLELILNDSSNSVFFETDYLKFNSSRYVTVGEGQMYRNIQDALDNIKDQMDNRITIIVYPGVYPFFKTNKIENRKRYIDIIGLSKRDCIIRDDSGDYYKSPAQMWFDGLVANMTFFATHDEEITPVSGLKSYALHMDYGANNAKFKNCYFYSEQASAIGIGTYQDDYIEFENCDAISNIKSDYFEFAYLPHYGAIFIHSAIGDNITNQNVVAKSCYFKGSGDYSAYLTCVSTQWNFSKDIKALLIGNTFANQNNEAKLRMEFKLDSRSHSNNNSKLNVMGDYPII